MREGNFARLNVGETAAAVTALQGTNAKPAPSPVLTSLAALWPKHEKGVVAALEARMKERTKSLEGALQERAEREIADLTALLTELRRTILAELDAEGPQQLSLWEEPEREQLERNRAALRERAERIPAELARETAAVRARYAEPTPRLFPVALAYVIPERLAKS